MLKNLLTFIFILCTIAWSNAQSFSDDFESYDVGSYVGEQSPNWTTWSGTTGGTEDAQVVDDQAKSGTKSIYFYSTGQGPQDVVLPFGQKYTTGHFNLSFSIYVTEGTSAYWNFQQEATVGQIWAGNAYIRNDGLLAVDAGGASTASPFISGQWNDISYDIDLDKGVWTYSINGECAGTMAAPAAVASLDLFPLTANTDVSEFWIDDISYNYTETPSPKTVDAIIHNVQISGAGFVGLEAGVSFELTNIASSKINDVEITVLQGGSEIAKELFSGLDLAEGESVPLNLADIISIQEGMNIINISISSIDGIGSDDSPCNNTSIYGVFGIVKTPGKRVIVEELTGTWCGWCPRGHVFMEAMEEKYGEDFIGVAVHGGDIMEVSEYTDYVDGFPGVSGYPSAIVDRDNEMDPSQIEAGIVTSLQDEVEGFLDAKATYDEDLKEAIVTVTLTALEGGVTGSRRIGIIFTENHVTGTTAAYNQVNYYSGGQAGEMGGYENLPDPVPAAQMVYEQVARAVVPGPTGIAIGQTLDEGESTSFTFGVDLSNIQDFNNVVVIPFLIKGGLNGEFVASYDLTLPEAINNTVNTEDAILETANFTLSPNPAVQHTVLNFDVASSSEVEINVFNSVGQKIKGRNYGKLNGEQTIVMPLNDFQNGIYTVALILDGKVTTQKLVVAN